MLLSAPLWLAVSLAAEPAPSNDERGCDLSDAATVRAFNDGITAINAGDLAPAQRGFERALKKQPNCFMALQWAGEVAIRQARTEGILIIRRGMELYPDSPVFPVMASRLLFLAQGFDEALEAARHGRSLDPSNIEALEAELWALLRLGRYAEAAAGLDAATTADAHQRDCMRMEILIDQDLYDAATALVESCKAAPDQRRSQNTLGNLSAAKGEDRESGTGELAGIDEASRAMREERWADAARLYERELKLQSWNAVLKVQLAICYLKLGQNGKAKPLLEELFTAEDWVTVHTSGGMTGVLTKGSELEVEQMLRHGLFTLVEVLVLEERLEEAAVAQRKAEGRFGKTPELLASQIVLETAQGSPGVWTTAAAALRGHPDDVQIADAAGELAFAKPEGLNPETLALLAGAPSGMARYNTVIALGNARRYPECGAFAQAALPKIEAEWRTKVSAKGHSCSARWGDLGALTALYDPANPNLEGAALALHGWLLHEAGRRAEALPLAQAALETESGGARAALLLATLAFESGKHSEALAYGEHARADSLTRANVGVLFYNAKRFDEARTILNGVDCSSVQPDAVTWCKEFLAEAASAR